MKGRKKDEKRGREVLKTANTAFMMQAKSIWQQIYITLYI